MVDCGKYAYIESLKMMKGTVRWFDHLAGFGYIQQNSDNHVNVLVYLKDVRLAGLHELHEGQEITFEITRERGKEYATNLQVKHA